MHVEHAHPIVTRTTESRPEEAVIGSRYNFRVVTTGQGIVSVSDYYLAFRTGCSQSVVMHTYT